MDSSINQEAPSGAKIDMYSDLNQDAFPNVQQQEQAENSCLLYTSPSPRDRQKSRMPSSA